MARLYRPTIWASFSKSRVISITDHLDIMKVTFDATNPNGGGDSVIYWMPFQTALAIAEQILSGKFATVHQTKKDTDQVGYTVIGRMDLYSGSRPSNYGGKVQSRLFSIEAIKDKEEKIDRSPYRYVINLKSGPGIEDPETKLIRPANIKEMVGFRCFLTLEEAYEMAAMLKMHIKVWYEANYVQLYDDHGKMKDKGGEVHDVFWHEIHPVTTKATKSADPDSGEIPT